MKLYDYLDITKLEEQIAEGYVNRNFHKTFTNLAIYTYSRSATLDYEWNEITCKCRGLIVDTATWDIIARPFEKFFNLDESAGITRNQFPDSFPQITDKLDGNLIILYPWDGRWWAASKGSFHSEHADWANEKIDHDKMDWPAGHTPVCEMIAEEIEHHVVHYGKDASGLYLLALINNETGEELDDRVKFVWSHRNTRINWVSSQPYLTLDEALADNEKNAEGYVFSWPRTGQTPLRVKVKFVDFLRLQKLVRHIGPKEILDYMRRPELKCYLDEVLNPETSHSVFIEYTKTWMSLFEANFNRIGIECNTILTELYKTLSLDSPRKAWAEQIRQCKYPAIMFAQLDYMLAALRADWSAEKNEEHKARISKLTWKQVEPVVEQVDDIRNIITGGINGKK